MKVADADILIVPGFKNSGPEHWQSRWQERLSTARRVEQDEWAKPVREDWVERLAETINAARKPVVVIAHSLGVATFVQAASRFDRPVAGAFLVAPPEVANPAIQLEHLMSFGPYPAQPLPCPSIVIASRNDPFGSFEHAGDMANAWGSLFIDAGAAGHIDDSSGHGPWPEGTMVFARFLSRLKQP